MRVVLTSILLKPNFIILSSLLTPPRKAFLLSHLSFLLSPLIPLCGLESAYARQRSSKLGAALAYSQISHFSFLI